MSEISKDGKVFNTGFEALASRFRHAGIPFFIWLHPEKTELERGTYNREGKEILEFCVRDTVPVIEGLKYMSFDDYRDNIHLNEHGQQKLAEHLSLFSERILTMYE